MDVEMTVDQWMTEIYGRSLVSLVCGSWGVCGSWTSLWIRTSPVDLNKSCGFGRVLWIFNESVDFHSDLLDCLPGDSGWKRTTQSDWLGEREGCSKNKGTLCAVVTDHRTGKVGACWLLSAWQVVWGTAGLLRKRRGKVKKSKFSFVERRRNPRKVKTAENNAWKEERQRERSVSRLQSRNGQPCTAEVKTREMSNRAQSSLRVGLEIWDPGLEKELSRIQIQGLKNY